VQILAVHTFISALWGVGREARLLSFGLVGLTCVFTTLWVGIPNGLHKDYEAPTPVRHPQAFHTPSLSTDTVQLVLVLD
jgi:hypothetical protein